MGLTYIFFEYIFCNKFSAATFAGRMTFEQALKSRQLKVVKQNEILGAGELFGQLAEFALFIINFIRILGINKPLFALVG